EIGGSRQVDIRQLSLAGEKAPHIGAVFDTAAPQGSGNANLRQTLEAGACAAFAIANPDPKHFVVAAQFDLLYPVPAGKRYSWLDQHYPAGSAAIREAKAQINATVAHANLIATHAVFRPNYDENWFHAPFFDVEDEHFVKTDLWQIGQAALTLMYYFAEINEGRNVIKFVDNFFLLIHALRQRNNTLRAEMMATERFKRAEAKEKVRQEAKTKAC